MVLSNPQGPSSKKFGVHSENMPPKIRRAAPFSWAKGHGKLTPTARGVVYGMHLMGETCANIAAKMNVTWRTAKIIIQVEAELTAQKDPDASSDDEDPATRACSLDSQVAARREEIHDMMFERK